MARLESELQQDSVAMSTRRVLQRDLARSQISSGMCRANAVTLAPDMDISVGGTPSHDCDNCFVIS